MYVCTFYVVYILLYLVSIYMKYCGGLVCRIEVRSKFSMCGYCIVKLVSPLSFLNMFERCCMASVFCEPPAICHKIQDLEHFNILCETLLCNWQALRTSPSLFSFVMFCQQLGLKRLSVFGKFHLLSIQHKIDAVNLGNWLWHKLGLSAKIEGAAERVVESLQVKFGLSRTNSGMLKNLSTKPLKYSACDGLARPAGTAGPASDQAIRLRPMQHP